MKKSFTKPQTLKYRSFKDCPDIHKHTACPTGYIQWHNWADKSDENAQSNSMPDLLGSCQFGFQKRKANPIPHIAAKFGFSPCDSGGGFFMKGERDMRKPISILCDTCKKELVVDSQQPARYGIEVRCVDYGYNTSGIVNLSIKMPPLQDDHHFCGLACLKSWAERLGK
jgi:hypothetical protein